VLRSGLDGTELARFDQLVDPGCLIPASATRINGITQDMVEGKPTVADVLPEFVQFLGDDDTVLMAHNALFDVGFLATALAKSGTAYPPHAIIDTVELSQVVLPGLATYRLESLAQRLGLAKSEDHRGLADSLLLKSLFLHLVARATVETLDDLYALSEPYGFDSAGVYLIDPPPGYEELSVAMAEQQTITMVYAGGTRGAAPRTVTPRSLYQNRGTAYLIAFCHVDAMDKTYRLDRIVEFCVDAK
jgi:DNA polymerase-3 subunit epsilon